MFNNCKLNLLNYKSPIKVDFKSQLFHFEPYYLNVMNKSNFIENEKKRNSVNLDDFKDVMLDNDK